MISKKILWDNESKVNIDIIKSIENLWNIKFPKEYIDIVLLYDSSTPNMKNEKGEWKQGKIDIPEWRGETISFGLISYMESEYFKVLKIIHTYNCFKDRLPEPDKIFPFAQSGGGDILFFDYRKNPDEPAIVFMDHEEAFTEEDITKAELKEKPVKEWLEMNLFPVCNSFSELLDLLYIDEED